MKRLVCLLMMGFSLAAAETKSEIHLNIAQGGVLSTAIIQNVYKSMGFNATLRHFSATDTMVEMDLEFHGKKPFDPKSFIELLDEHQIVLRNTRLENKRWVLGLDASRAFWNIPAISEDEGAQIERTILPYWFLVKKAAGISIEAPYGSAWYPEIAVLDDNMQVLASYHELKSRDRMSFKLPERAAYLKVSNHYGMKLLKEGMWVEAADDVQE